MTTSDKNILSSSGAGRTGGCCITSTFLCEVDSFLPSGSAHGFQLLIKRRFCQLYNSWRWFLKQDYDARFWKHRIQRNISFSADQSLICVFCFLVCLDVLNTITCKHPLYLLWRLMDSFFHSSCHWVFYIWVSVQYKEQRRRNTLY